MGGNKIQDTYIPVGGTVFEEDFVEPNHHFLLKKHECENTTPLKLGD